tara:strand:- start:631 stop:1158 length:528 start_codon:yes stop_codon:yes gene_type:complete
MLYLKIKHLSKTQENADIFSKNDMFVEIIYGDKIRRTMTLWNNNEPVWDETFLFPKTDNETIILVVKDDDVWSKDEELLRIEIPVHYQKVKSVVQDGLAFDIGNVFYKARVINYKNKKKIEEQNEEITELQETIGDLKTTTGELKDSLDKISKENIILSNKLLEIRKIVKKQYNK